MCAVGRLRVGLAVIAQRVADVPAIDRDGRGKHNGRFGAKGAAAFQNIVGTEQIDVHTHFEIFLCVGGYNGGQQIDDISVAADGLLHRRGVGNVTGDAFDIELGVNKGRFVDVGKGDFLDCIAAQSAALRQGLRELLANDAATADD